MAALLLALGGLAATVPGYLEGQPGEVFVKGARSRLATLAAGPRGENLRVVAFGSSLLRNATYFDDEMEQLAAETAGLRLDFLRLYRGGHRIHDLIPLFDAILAAAPDLLLWQWSGLSIPDFDEAAHRAYQEPGLGTDSRSSLRRLGRAFEGIGVFQHQAHVVRTLKGSLRGRRHRDPIAVHLRRQRGFDCPTGLEADRVLDQERLDPARLTRTPAIVVATLDLFLRRARERGIRVVFLEIPMHRSLEEMAGPARRRLTALEAIARWSSQGLAEALVFPEPLGESAYCSLAHMNRAGQRRYSEWLVRELEARRP